MLPPSSSAEGVMGNSGYGKFIRVAEATLIKPEKSDDAGVGNPSPSHKEGPGVTGLELT